MSLFLSLLQGSLEITQLNNATMTHFSSSSGSGILNYFRREFAGREKLDFLRTDKKGKEN